MDSAGLGGLRERSKWKRSILGVAESVVQGIYVNTSNRFVSHHLKAVSTGFDGTACAGEFSGANIFHNVCRQLSRTSS